MKSDEATGFFNKLRQDKKTAFMIVIAVIGIFLVCISDSGTDSNSGTQLAESSEIISEAELAKRLEELIEAIDGAGKTKAMVTYKSYEETVYARNSEQSTDYTGDMESSEEYIILDKGDTEEGMRIKILLPEIRGVAVVCEGAESPVIRERIISTVSALFNISSNKISVASMAR